MGVKGLWKLVLPIGRRISIETLSGQTLAIDASIWLTQFIKAMRDPVTGKVVSAAHLIGFFRRICRLYYHGVKPIFVFDGATPEIKRNEVLRRKRQREVFASNLNDMTVQRLAKRLLSDNLHKAGLKRGEEKQGKSEEAQDEEDDGGGAYAPGFNPGAQRTAASSAITSESTNAPTDGEVQRDLEDLLAQEPANPTRETLEAVSDWDLPLAVAAAEEAKEMDEEEDGDSSNTYSDDEDGFVPDIVASLPADKRKDAIEKAKRAQRMQSRKEFMPAAAKPQDFSSVQLKNFIKYCKLNQDIVSMAKKASSRESGGMEGRAMASDLTTRIELTRDEEEIDEDGDEEEDDEIEISGGPKSLLKEKLDSRKRQRACIGTQESSSDEDQDFCDGDTTQRESAVELYDSDESSATPLHRNQQRNLVHIHDSSDDEHEDPEPEEYPRSPPCPAQGLQTQHKGRGLLTEHDGDALIAQEMEDRNLALALQEEDDDQSMDAHFETSKPHALRSYSQEDPSTPSRMPNASNTGGNGDLNQNSRQGAGEHKNTELSSESSDDDIDWEDGNDVGSSLATAQNSIQPGFTGTNMVDTDTCSIKESKQDEDVLRFPNAAWGDEENPKDAFVSGAQETTAALQQAQETASHLTNWAGRAFRRAMKDVGGEGSDGPPTKDAEQDSDVQKEIAPDDISNMPRPNDRSNAPARQAPIVHDAAESRSRRRQAVQDSSATETELIDWTSARNRRERDIEGISDEMLIEAKQLLQLFGVPYVEAPAEAEATCVALEQLGLVNGIVSDDSDVFVFGGKTVYKNIFEEQRFAEVYKAADAEKEMGLNQNAMIALAMLLGSDYTEGVKGVGIVNAMEILRAFDVSADLKGGLARFRKWMDGVDPSSISDKATADPNTAPSEYMFQIQHRSARTRWEAPANFPSDSVMNAYLNPVVDRSGERFSWGAPDVKNLVGFCEAHMGWFEEDIRRQLQPVVEARVKGPRQTRLHEFMKYDDAIKFGEIKSKRLRKALGLRETIDHGRKPAT